MEELEQQQTFGFIMPSSPADRKHIMDVVKEISGSKTRQEGERDFQKEAINDLYDKFKIPKSLLRRFANVYHRQNYTEVLATDSDFETMVETLLNADSNSPQSSL
jgi:hypothetical protein